MPIQRDESLKPLSREHHHGLLLCWKIRTGYKKSIEERRIRAYAYWFYRNYLIPHFEIEETHVFPVLGNDHGMVKRALGDHRKLRRLFEGLDAESNNLVLIEEKLEEHIRFEERILFNEIQAVATSTQLEEVERKHAAHLEVEGEWEDEFWK